MNRIDRCFQEEGKKLITFLVIDDPDHETSFKNISAMIENGADIVELGIPFSDPMAEGIVIQKANERAISSGYRLDDAFSIVRRLRERYETPLLFLMYFNIIYRYGVERFLEKCSSIGIDGLIIPDLPYEEQGEIKAHAKEHGINIISLISLTSKERMIDIAKDADQFLYCVSSMGVTGVRDAFSDDIFQLADELEKTTDKKRAVGFGISKPEHVKRFKEYFDGVIVGSAFVRLCENKDKKKIPDMIGDLTRCLKNALL